MHWTLQPVKRQTEEQAQSTLTQSKHSQQALHSGLLAKPMQDIQELGKKTFSEVSGCSERSRANVNPRYSSSVSPVSCLSSTAMSTPGTSYLWSDGLLTYKAPRRCSFTLKGLLLHVLLPLCALSTRYFSFCRKMLLFSSLDRFVIPTHLTTAFEQLPELHSATCQTFVTCGLLAHSHPLAQGRPCVFSVSYFILAFYF